MRRPSHILKGIWEGCFMWKKITGTRKTFLPVFLTGFAAGILYMVLFGRGAAHETALLGRYFFSRCQQAELACGELLRYTLKSLREPVYPVMADRFYFLWHSCSFSISGMDGGGAWHHTDDGSHEAGLCGDSGLPRFWSAAVFSVCACRGLAFSENL